MGPSTCKYEYAEQLKEVKLQLALANETIQRLVNRDYCQKELDRIKDHHYMIRRAVRQERLTKPQYQKQKTWKMVTLTFDRSHFKHLNSRSSQRDYILYALGHFYDKIRIYGCFELHEDGVVHSHFMTPEIDNDTLENIKLFFTKKDSNIYAVHVCDKSLEEAYKYITKEETKDPNEQYNYFLI
jgi:hypothetical protein